MSERQLQEARLKGICAEGSGSGQRAPQAQRNHQKCLRHKKKLKIHLQTPGKLPPGRVREPRESWRPEEGQEKSKQAKCLHFTKGRKGAFF